MSPEKNKLNENMLKFQAAMNKAKMAQPASPDTGNTRPQGSGRFASRAKLSPKETTVKSIGKALIVDPDQRIANMLALQLKSARFEPIIAGSAAEALAEAKKEPPRIMLISMDLPDMPGFNCCSKLRVLPGCGSDTVPIMMMTSEWSEEKRDTALMMDANDLLGKPIKTPELMKKIRELCGLQN